MVSRSVYMVKHPRRSFVVHALLSLEVATRREQINSFDDVIHVQERTHKVPKSASQAGVSMM